MADNLLGNLFAPVTKGISDSLPTKQEAIQGYMGAVLAFWLIGGIALYIVIKATKSRN